jgi:TM2 domain-containing membrane protein YozV
MPENPPSRRKDYVSRIGKRPVLILCLFFGFLGIHRFYLQKFRSGALQLFTLGGLGLWTIRDLYKIVTGQFKDQRGYRIQRWT